MKGPWRWAVPGGSRADPCFFLDGSLALALVSALALVLERMQRCSVCPQGLISHQVFPALPNLVSCLQSHHLLRLNFSWNPQHSSGHFSINNMIQIRVIDLGYLGGFSAGVRSALGHHHCNRGSV